MPWTQKQMLRDANGDLIPQYWDVVEQEFKPLTGSDGANDVRLTGSYLEYDIIAPGDEYINIPVGSEFETDIIEVEANEIVLGGRTGSALMGAEFYIAFSYRESVSLTGELVKMFELVGGGERESDHFTQTERTLMAGKGFKIVVKNDKSNRILRLDRLTAKFFNF